MLKDAIGLIGAVVFVVLLMHAMFKDLDDMHTVSEMKVHIQVVNPETGNMVVDKEVPVESLEGIVRVARHADFNVYVIN